MNSEGSTVKREAEVGDLFLRSLPFPPPFFVPLTGAQLRLSANWVSTYVIRHSPASVFRHYARRALDFLTSSSSSSSSVKFSTVLESGIRGL